MRLKLAFCAVLVVVFTLVCSGMPAYSECTMTPGDPIRNSNTYGSIVTLPLVCTCDSSGGSISSTVLPDKYIIGSQLIEVEVAPGSTCDAAAVSLDNGRGTEVWALSAIDTSESKIYGGHTKWGIFPVMDDDWYFSAGDLGADGSATIYIKMSK